MAERMLKRLIKGDFALRELLFIPLFLSLYSVYHLFYDSGFQLEIFVGRPISVATSEGIDIAKRVGTFYKAFLGFIFSVLVLYFLLQRLSRFIQKQDLQLLNASSAAGFCLLFFQLLGAEMDPSLHLILAFQLVVFTGIGLKSIWKFDDSDDIYITLLVWIATLAFCLYFLQFQLLALAGIKGTPSMPVFLAVFSISLLIFYFLLHRMRPLTAASIQKTIRISSTLAFIPFLSVFATELYMILNQHNIHGIGIGLLYGLHLLLLVIWILFLNRKLKHQNTSLNSGLSPEIEIKWFPALAAGIAALANYSPIVSPQVDWFEDANRILPLQQYFDFGKIPFLDTFSSHAFSDFGPGALFSLLNGHNPLGGFVYQFLIPVIVTVVIYYLIFRITGNGLMAFFLAIFYPYSDFILPSYYNLIPVTALALLNIYRKQSVKNYFLFFLVIFLMIFWRIDLGSANLVAGVGGLLLLFFAVQEFKLDVKKLLKGLALVFMTVVLLILAAFFIHDGNIFSHLSEALGYMSSFQSYGLKDLSGTKDMKYYSLYFILPLAVLLTAGNALLRLYRNKDEKKETTQLALSILFMSIFFFANFQRGLVRHTLAEGWDTALTSYGFFILAISIFFHSGSRNNKAIGFCLFISLSTLLVVNYKFSTPELTRNNMYFAAGLNVQKAIFPAELHGKVNRTPEPKEMAEKYSELNNFFKAHFPDSSTFLDFSNTPMLYYYLHRATPNYFCQIPHTAHNDNLQKQLLDGLNKYDIPVVIFSNVPYNYWDYLDGIPNTLRHYRISEYIYRNYRPYAILDNHSVWLKKGLSINEIPNSKEIELRSLSNVEIRGGSRTDSMTFSANPEENLTLPNLLPSPLTLNPVKKYYLSSSLLSGTQGTFSVLASFRTKQGTETRKIEIHISHGYSEPFIILDTKPGEEFLQSLDILLPGASTYTIKSIKLFECNFLPDLYSKQPQEQSLKWIPYVWGNFDSGNQKQQTASNIIILNQLLKQQAGREIRFNVPVVSEKAGGSYIRLKARSGGETDADIILNYGAEDEKYGGYIFKVSKDQKFHEYKIRVSSQYNWQSRDTGWLSVYPAGSDVEIELIEIEKGD